MGAAYLQGAAGPRHGAERFWCEGKQPFASPTQAYAVTQRGHRPKDREAYRCDSCGLWHVGQVRMQVSKGWRNHGR